MRLINLDTLHLDDFISSDDVPPYAILSHTWEAREEVSYAEWLAAESDPGLRDRLRAKKGHAKILGAADKARALGYGHLWVDTNCIDKTSSAELSEAINSMFAWYKRSKVCLVHLADVADVAAQPGNFSSGPDPDSGPGPDLEQSRWFRRGWTLQELLAPRRLIFYSASWQQVGTISTLEKRLSAICGIAGAYIRKDVPLWSAGVAEKLSWLAGRTTTREEDMAYCMLGIFRINMPLLYGEGSRAFVRLQEEIIRRTNDHTIFAWHANDHASSVSRHEVPSILARSPRQFARNEACPVDFSTTQGHNPAFAWTNAGLNIEVPIIHCYRSHYIVLDANLASNLRHHDQRLCLPIDGNLNKGIVGRATVAAEPIIMPVSWAPGYRSLFFPPSPEKWISSPRRRDLASSTAFLITFNKACKGTYPILVSVDTASIAKSNDINLALTSHFDPYSSLLELSSSQDHFHDSDSTPTDETPATSRFRSPLYEAMLLLTVAHHKFLVWVCLHEVLSDEGEDDSENARHSEDATRRATAHYVFPPVAAATPTSGMREAWLREKRAFLSARRRKARLNQKGVVITRGPATSVEGVRTLVPLHFQLSADCYS
ncbi:heterokaryon incompatibility protein-domain-containing protein [Microdochium bolleyi]|uniref:Heterokaryon incompatibility protein-domain-containing protein n=1 Tax=Microdochium bolleyi TaxID=196109 RepID=A0A136IR58_9PEZI|nr:heterokaryon incompatibility protein-domain-containing protein [Microdochium bolleyi]